MKTKRVILCIFLSLLLILCYGALFAGTEKEEVTPERAPLRYDGVKLRIALVPGLTELPPLHDCLVEAASELGAQIEVSWYSFDEQHDKLVIDYTGGNPVWDYVFVQSSTRAEWAESGLVISMEKFINEHPELVDEELLAMDDFLPVSMDENKYKGEWQGFPLYVTGTNLFYRKDLFNHPEEKKSFKAKYGYELAVPKYYDQFYDIAEFFTRKKGDTLAGEPLQADFYGCSHSNKPINFLWFDYVNYLMAFGADNIYNSDTMRPTFNSRESISSGEYYVSLVPFLPPGHLTMASGGSTSMFAEGSVAMIIEFFGRGLLMAMNPEKSKVADKVDFDLSPTARGVKGRQAATIHTGNQLSIYGLSKNKEAAYKVAELAFSHRIMKKVYIEKHAPYGWIPPRPSVLDDPEVNEVASFLKSVLQKLLDPEKVYFFFTPTLPEYKQAMDICGTALSNALAGKIDVRKAYNKAQNELEELFKKAGYIK